MIPDARRSLAFALILLLSMAVPAAAQEDEPTAAALLDRLDSETGSRSDADRARSLTIEGTVDVGGVVTQGKLAEAYAGQRARLRMQVPGFGIFAEGFDGEVVWDVDPVAGVIVKRGSGAEASRRLYALLSRAMWRSLYAEAVHEGVVQIDGRDVDKLAMRSATGTADHWYLSRSPLRLARVEMPLLNAAGSRVLVTIDFTEWKLIDGVLYPHRRVVRVGKSSKTVRCASIEHAAALADDTFTPPAAVAAALEDPEAVKRSAIATRIKDVKPQHAAVVSVKCKPAEISRQFGIIYPEIMVHLNSIGAKSAGAPFACCTQSGEMVQIRAGIPVTGPVEPRGRVKPYRVPGGKVAAAWHLGPYHELSSSHARLGEWLKRHGWEATAPAWEIYWTDPGMEPDPRKWRTEIRVPVRKADRAGR